MPSLRLPRLSNARFAAMLAVVLALFVSGVVAGAAGGYLILGAANSAGTSNTSLTTGTTGTAFLVTQTSSGTALRGVAGVGIAGFFTSANGAGVSGVVGNANSYGVYAANDSSSTGTGAALRAAGKKNYALVASSDDKPPIKVSGPGNMAPFELNSSIKVTNLNADLLDGLSATELLLGTALIPSGVTVTGTGDWDYATIADNHDVRFMVELPARAPVVLTDTDVNFAPNVLASDDDATCTGTYNTPTAPAGKVCIYVVGGLNLDGAFGTIGNALGFQDRFFKIVFFTNSVALGADMYLEFAWAYTAP